MSTPRPPDGPARTRRLRRDAIANQRRLAAAAVEVFAGLGPAAQLEDIARHAGLGVGTAYRHLGSREAALHEVLAVRISELAILADEADQMEDPWEAVCWYLRELAAKVASDHGLMALIINQGVSADQVEQLRDRIEPRTLSLFNRAKASGQLRSDANVTDIPLIVMCIDRVARTGPRSAPEAWRRILVLILDGLAAHRASTTSMIVQALNGRQLAEIGTGPSSFPAHTRENEDLNDSPNAPLVGPAEPKS